MTKKAKNKLKNNNEGDKNISSTDNIKKSKVLINDIFKSLKTTSNKNNSETSDKIKAKNIAKGKPRNRSDKIEEYCTIAGDSKSRRRTEDNLPIYTMEELNIGKGGNTELCPFDCNCCF